MDIIRGHVRHLQELERSGQLVMCGLFSDAPGGMVIICAESHEEAVAIAERDPYILSASAATSCAPGTCRMKATSIWA
jgi:uncharacterized protein